MRLLVLGICACQAGGAAPVAHVHDAAGQPLPQYEPAWQRLATLFGPAMPTAIGIEHVAGSVSGFDANRDVILFADGSLASQSELALVAHETCHLALAHATHGASTEEQLRFLDEGLATVLAHEIDGTLAQYRHDAHGIARLRGFAQLPQLAQWSTFFGRASDHPDWHAYDVAADFVLFLRDERGDAGLRELFATLARTRTFDDVAVVGRWASGNLGHPARF